MKLSNVESYVFAVVLVGGGVLLIVAPDEFCRSKMISKAIDDGTAASCTEFLLNRYQSLIGAAVALIAAYTAWLSVIVQVRKQAQQRQRDEALATLQLFVEITTLNALMHRFRPEAIDRMFREAIDMFIALRFACNLIKRRVEDARRFYESYLASWRGYRASESLKLRLVPMNASAHNYFDEIISTMDALERGFAAVPSTLNEVPAPLQASLLATLEGLAQRTNNQWKRHIKNIDSATNDIVDVFKTYESLLSSEEIASINARVKEAVEAYEETP